MPDAEPEGVSPALDRIRETAARDKQVRFTALLHHVTVDLLRWSYWAISRRLLRGRMGSRGGLRAGSGEQSGDLHQRVHRGAYRAKPSRRQYIPKPDGRQRPLGIAALEDKIVQRAVGEVLNAIYETDFLGFSYGFRPGRSQHDALDALATGIYRRKVNWIVDADIRAFFDSMNHDWLMRFLEHRIADRRLLRLIGKWLKAGVLEEGRLLASGQGTPQGAVISPLLANIYLHYVYRPLGPPVAAATRARRGDRRALRRRHGGGLPVRADARRFLAELAQRLEKFGLQLHPEKTRIIEFGRFAGKQPPSRGLASRRPSTSWGSRISAGSTGREGSSSGGTRSGSGCGQAPRGQETIRRMMHLPIQDQGPT